MTLLATYFPITDPTLIFFVVLLIILFAPIVMSKLRIPHIIGMVLAGILIGKYGFNILERDNSFELFGRVGLYYIMFLAGLEMDMEGVKKHSRQFIIFGLLTCFVPLILTYIMSRTILGYNHPASFLLGCIRALELKLNVVWMVIPPTFAAAIPVGAQTITFFPADIREYTIARSRYDFPVPAPPVINTFRPLLTASRAFCWSGVRFNADVGIIMTTCL